MINHPNNLFQRKPGVMIGLMLLSLLAMVMLIKPDRFAAAQTPEADLVFEASSYASDSGDAMIVSEQTRLDWTYLGQTGDLDGVQVTPNGLTLVEDVYQGTYTSGPVRSPLSFTTDIGPAWLADLPEGTAVTVEYRQSPDGASWGEWAVVPVEVYPIRDGEYGGSLIWLDQAEVYVQFKLTLETDGSGAVPYFQYLALYFNDTSQGPTTEVASAQGYPDQNVCPAKPHIIRRSVWGCPPGQTSPYWPPSYQPITHVVINHTATPNSASDWARVVRSIWHYHAHVLGWGDVGYNYLIDPLGNIYEGRAGGDDVIGAFDGFNRGAMGIGYIGCYGNCKYLGIPNADPSEAMLDAGNDLIAWKFGQKGIDPLGEGPYCHKTLPNIVARSDVTCRGASLSPGSRLEARIADIRAEVAERLEMCTTPTNPPDVQQVTPSSGFVSQEITLLVKGSNFKPAESGFKIELVATNNTKYALTVVSGSGSATQFQAKIPANLLTPGFYDVTVTNADGQSDTLADAYEAKTDPGGDGPVVRITPASLQIGLGANGQTAVEAVEVTNLFGVELELTYDPNIVNVVDADAAKTGVQVELGDFFDGVDFLVVKNEAKDGKITLAATRQAPAPGFTGATSLVNVTWQGKNSGQTALTLTKLKLSTPNGQAITATPQPGQIQVKSGVIVKGHVELQSRNNHSGVTVKMGEQQVQTGADGNFSLAAQAGSTYSITLTMPGFLNAQSQGQIPAQATEVELGSMTMLGGDVNLDNEIDIFDLSFIGSRYGSNDAAADLNQDALVDIFDLSLAASNYDRHGPIVIEVDNQQLSSILSSSR